MIIDLPKFVSEEQRYWTELESVVRRLEGDPGYRMGLEEVKRFHYLYQRTSADLARIATFSSEPEIRRYLESLVARAYGEVHETRGRAFRLAPLHWFLRVFPRTFRRHSAAFYVSLAATLAGCMFGGLAILLDPDAKAVIMPLPGLAGDPAKRVEEEEKAVGDRLGGVKSTFSAALMTHNLRVSILVMALGLSWGIGTVILLFYNGVILGAVTVDYVLAKQTAFVAGWLMPHGAIEIPAILIAGQAGLVLAGALIGWGAPVSLKMRLRRIADDLLTLILGVAILLAWAGLVESFLSQYHEPIVPYPAKIAFGAVELVLLALFLAKSGRSK